jgi:hypothetical protein
VLLNSKIAGVFLADKTQDIRRQSSFGIGARQVRPEDDTGQTVGFAAGAFARVRVVIDQGDI